MYEVSLFVSKNWLVKFVPGLVVPEKQIELEEDSDGIAWKIRAQSPFTICVFPVGGDIKDAALVHAIWRKGERLHIVQRPAERNEGQCRHAAATPSTT